MGIDGLFLYGLKKEISDACANTRVEKIYQPSKEELVILLRSAGLSRRLLICARPSAPRMGFIEGGVENPSEPPMFCMLARKYLSGARFSHIEDNGAERIAVLVFDSVNEMGDGVQIKLAAEFIGKRTNIILIGGGGRIIDSLRRSDLEAAGRVIQPGAKYVYPERQEKTDILRSPVSEAAEHIEKLAEPLYTAVISAVDGISPLISREIAAVSGIDAERRSDSLDAGEKGRLINALEKIRERALYPVPFAAADENGDVIEFSYTELVQYGASSTPVRFGSLSELLEKVYGERDRSERIRASSNDLARLLGNIRARIIKKKSVREKELAKCADGERLRICGELLKANAYRLERGIPYIDVQNYYDPELKSIRIPLNTALSPAKNIQKYFKDYRKCCGASSVLAGLIDECSGELEYIESVIEELSRAQTVSDVNEIKLELAGSGYLRVQGGGKNSKKQQPPAEAVSPDGYRVLIGRNNRQNDELTLKTAGKGDMWFHAKNMPGSHVIVVCDGGDLPEATLRFAAGLAAFHSKGRDSSSVPVDYTRVKYVKKPAGAKPGMVIYKTNKTVYVKPLRGTL